MIWLLISATVVSALAWAAVFFPGMPWWIAAVVTLVLFLAVTVVVVVRKVRAVGRAAALERELLRQADEQADHLRPDRRPEVLELKARMKQALEALKTSKLGRGGSAALYALPWYVIVGPPAAGKTTALQQSGLPFIAPNGGSPRLQGTAGTKNCDWWFSNDAILLDTAGRFVTKDDDEAEWHAFLDTLKRFRGKKPLDGIVVAVSLADLLDAHGDRVEELAQRLRAKVDELLERLEVVLPMYVLFTKADLVGGFVEFWSDLNAQQRGQVFGATFALGDERLEEPASAFEEEFDELVASLHARMLQQLPEERLTGARARVLQFPAEFRAMKPALSRFVGELCAPNPYKEHALCRGFYFTSGTQVGRPFDRVLSSMLAGFGLSNLAAFDSVGASTPRSYFVTDLFKTVIFPDRHAGVRSGSFVRSRLRTQVFVAGGSFLAALTVMAASAVAYVQNRDVVAATARRIDEARRAPPEQIPQELDALLDRVSRLEADAAAFSIRGLVGPYSASSLLPPVRRLYVTELRGVVEGPLRENVVADLRSVGNLVRLDDPDNFQSAYDDVKLYVLMTEPAPFASENGQALKAWAAQHLAEKWAKVQGSPALDPERLKLHATYYVDAVAKDGTWSWAPNTDALSAARRRLSDQPLEALQYSWLLRAARNVAPVRPDQIFLGAAAVYVTSRAPAGVDGAYTRDGWAAVKAGSLSERSAFVVEPWVLGAPVDAARSVTPGRLRDMYFDNYVRAWRDFLGNLTVATPTSVDDAISELRALDSVENGPYASLFRTLATNAHLDMSPTSLADKLLDRAKGAAANAAAKLGVADAGAGESKLSPVEDRLSTLVRFGGGGGHSPSPLAQCLDELATLEVKLVQLRESQRAPTTELSDELAHTSTIVERLLEGLDGATRLLVEPLLMNPIRGTKAGIATTGNSALSDKWKAEVWTPYDEKIAHRYPFADGPDVALADFVEFFRPKVGTLWGFFDRSLSDRLQRSGTAYSPLPSPEPSGFNPQLLRCLGDAQSITDATFGTGADAAVPFTVKLDEGDSGIQKVTLTIDGQTLVHKHEADQWFPAQWPGPGPSRGGVLSVAGPNYTDETPRNGDFGLFRLLASGGLRARREAGLTYVASFPSRGGEAPVTVSVRPSRAIDPFGSDFFSRLKCPQTIGGGADAP